MQQLIACTLVNAQARVVFSAVAHGYERRGLEGDLDEARALAQQRAEARAPPYRDGSWASAIAATTLSTVGPRGFCERGDLAPAPAAVAGAYIGTIVSLDRSSRVAQSCPC